MNVNPERPIILLIICIFLHKANTISILEKDEIINHEYPIAILRSIPNEKHFYNLLTSPLSFRYDLIFTGLFAHGETRNDIEKLMFGTTYKQLIEHLGYRHDEIFHYRVFLNEKFAVTPCVDKFISPFKQTLDFTDVNKSATTINAWVRRRSNNALFQITLPKFHHDSLFLIWSHVEYFETVWKKPFTNLYPKGDNSTGILFTGAMLQQDNFFKYGYREDLDSVVLEIELKDEDAKMIVIQPATYIDNFEDLKNILRQYDLRTLTNDLEMQEISLYFPLLKGIKMDRSMVETMKRSYGIEKPFIPSTADFRKWNNCGRNSYVQYFNQRSRIYTNDKQFRIGSVTGIQLSFDNARMGTISDDDDDDDDDDNLEKDELNARVVKEPKKSLPKVILAKPFFYGIVRQNALFWIGTIYKPHNLPKDTTKAILD